MSSEHYRSPRLLQAIRSKDSDAAKKYGELGAQRSKERAQEKKSRQAEIDELINEVKFKILEIDAQLKAFQHKEHTNADGDVELLLAIDPEVIYTLKELHEELKLQLASLEDQRALIK